MVDRETVIAALEYCAVGTNDCHGCPMKDNCKGVSNGVMAAAARLLKEQGPVEPRYEKIYGVEPRYEMIYGDKVAFCGNCNKYLGGVKYCPFCGKAVKWDAAD